MHPLSILLVDDEQEFLDLMSKRMEKRNVRVECAASGRQALDILAGTQVDVVVLDVKMPGMDGIATLERIRENHPKLPVILLTGHADLTVARQGLELGAADYILKPTTIGELLFKIRDVCLTEIMAIGICEV